MALTRTETPEAPAPDREATEVNRLAIAVRTAKKEYAAACERRAQCEKEATECRAAEAKAHEAWTAARLALSKWLEDTP